MPCTARGALPCSEPLQAKTLQCKRPRSSSQQSASMSAGVPAAGSRKTPEWSARVRARAQRASEAEGAAGTVLRRRMGSAAAGERRKVYPEAVLCSVLYGVDLPTQVRC